MTIERAMLVAAGWRSGPPPQDAGASYEAADMDPIGRRGTGPAEAAPRARQATPRLDQARAALARIEVA